MIETFTSNDEILAAITKNQFHPHVIQNHVINNYGKASKDFSDRAKKRYLAITLTTEYIGISTGKKSLYIWNGIHYQFIAEKGRNFFGKKFIFSVLSPAIDNIVTLHYLLHHLGDIRRIIL